MLLVTHSYSLKNSSSLIFNALDQSVLPMLHGKCVLHGPVLENKFPLRRVYQGQEVNAFRLFQCVSDSQFYNRIILCLLIVFIMLILRPYLMVFLKLSHPMYSNCSYYLIVLFCFLLTWCLSLTLPAPLNFSFFPCSFTFHNIFYV